MSTTGQVGARSLGRERGKKGGGIWKLLLGLLLLLLLAFALITLLGSEDDNEAGSGANAPAVQQAAPNSGNAGGAAAVAGGAGAGTLVSGADTSLLGAGGGMLGGMVGEQATGTGIEVLSVAKQGFFVGTEEQDRVYVEFGADVGEDETARDYTPSAGDTVDLRGEIRPAPEDPGRTLRLEAPDANVVEAQGGFINATNVSKSS